MAPALLATTLWGSTCLASPPEPLAWKADWARFRASEAAATSVLALQAASALLLYPVPDATWQGQNPADELLRDALRLRGREARNTLRTSADVLYYGLAAFPFLVDTAAFAWGIHGSADVALQMLALNAESYALTGALALTAQKLGRERPSTRGCRESPEYSPKCSSAGALSESFFSGHTAIAFTSAGLTCAHHEHLPLLWRRRRGCRCLPGRADGSDRGGHIAHRHRRPLRE